MSKNKYDYDAVVLIPTYNEAENIRPLLEEIFSLPCNLAVVVLDDGSPDGTADIVKKMTRTNEKLTLLTNPGKEGLGRAYLRGFRYVSKNIDAEFIITMDADFSHDPSRIPRFLLAARENDLDLVAGSRYIRGGDTPDWDYRRRILSRTANFYCQTLLGSKIHDYTSGFRCYRAQKLFYLDLTRVKSVGYGFMIEMASLFERSGLRLGEIPIIFPDRKLGISKLHGGIIKEAFLLVLRLACRRFWSIL